MPEDSENENLTQDNPGPNDQNPNEADIQRLQENVSQFRQYEKKYKSEIAELKRSLKEHEKERDMRRAADAEAEKARLAEEENWKELAQKAESENANLAQKLADLEVEFAETRRTAITVDLARELGAINPTDLNFRAAVAEIDISAGDGEARSQIRQILESMKESHAYLFKPETEKAAQRALPTFDPSGEGAVRSEAQRIARLKQLTGQGHWGMFGEQSKTR